ncbi:hypothetical protein QLQ12_33580 [Actinoplanes sp. NEAU-A12]|uniref:YbaB/EbfC DNA-binding family protein n=1 Tax=Actinoplanes sandaracinus TaxID=3045177 RepID=A0ABT6WUY1_9ACTN|nr:hypothetical protein [Actinoplanes sandaracinus]MDI6103554.1 hypothetical protein [Actinoplanes sandaracinus]
MQFEFEDYFRDLRDVHHKADALARRFSRAVPTETVTGLDETQCVEATVAPDGRLIRLGLHDGWREEVGEAHLGTAVIAAMSNAGQQRITSWAAAMTAETDPTPPPATPDPLSHATPGDPTSRQSAHALRELLDMLTQVHEALPGLTERAEAARTRPSTATNVNRTVRVSVQNDTVTSINVDGDWLRRIPDQQLADAIVEVLTAAQRLASDRQDEAVNGTPALARLRRLTESPEALLREVGLIE